MRILAIRGENLASLAEPFSLEFEQEPLRSCGLFAITGETGAGKSTILDALCLALYDTFPRVEATEASERAPDPSGELLKTRDPAPILRRGAGAGYAEVDFVARDGLRYRARCALQRARGKATGNLQPRRRSLWRIDTAGAIVETIESGIAPVNRRIVELTDLTFDQFCRTALLAQGDFDAFLRADAGKRADLLEKITGAEIYGLLSQRAYEMARMAQETLAQLERRKSDIGLLSEDDRAARHAEISTLIELRATTEEEIARIQNSLRRLESHALAEEKLRQAETESQAATRALEALAPQAAQLDLAERAGPLRSLWRDMRGAEEAARRQEEESTQAQESFLHAQEALTRTDAEEQAARLALEEIEQIIADFTPVWERARELDVRIIEAEEREAQTRRDAENARFVADIKQRALDDARVRQNEKLCEWEAAEKEATRCAPARPLAERFPEIEEWIAKRMELAGENRKVIVESESIKAELVHIGQFIASTELADTRDRAGRDMLAAQIAECEQALMVIDEENVASKAGQIGVRLAELRVLLGPAAAYARAEGTVRDAARIIEDRARAVADLTQELDDLRERRARLELENADAARLGELADAAADPHALRLRVTLDDETPCPVCGALEHPFSRLDDAAQQLVVELRARRAAARHALDKHDANIFQKESALAAAQAQRDTAQQQIRAAEADAAATAQSYAELRARYRTADIPPKISGAAPMIEKILEEREFEAQELARKLEAARRLRDERDKLTKRYNATRDALEQRQIERRSASERQQKFGERSAELVATLSHNGERIASLDRSLAPFLDVCGLTSGDLDLAPAKARARMAQEGQNYQKAQEALKRLAQERSALDLRIATLSAETQAAAEAVTAQTQSHSARRKAFDDLRAMRADLLNGEGTLSHRRRHEETRKARGEEFEQKRSERSLAVEHAVAARTLAEENARDARSAIDAARCAQDAFVEACAAAGLARQTAVDLLAASEEEISALREQLRLARERCAATVATAAARAQDVEISGRDLPELSPEDLRSHVAELGARLEETSARVSALDALIKIDDAGRIRADSLSREIEAARATAKLWDDINAAIGSRSGDKFRRFAQSVTLDQLVALANQKLGLLSPRYRLEKSGEIDSLGLQIVDRDLGDERRSTRSLSGGERFLASLALALALAGLEGRDSFVDTLFIDEGFGSLDTVTLDIAIDALESLQGQGRKVGVISHVDSLQQRISTKISVERRGGGLSVVRLRAPGW